MRSRQTDKLCAGMLLLALYTGLSQAAEIRGTVSVDYQGLFAKNDAARKHPVSVALLPVGRSAPPPRNARTRRVEIIANRMQPAFITVRRGDRVEFVNRDNVYHELFTLSAGNARRIRIGKAGEPGDRATLRLSEIGTNHFFCRIHNKSYARIDVVETPYIRMIEPGGSFEFSRLKPGPWRLRVATPAAETAWIDVSAVTSPPPLQLMLKSRGGYTRPARAAAANVERLYSFSRPAGAAR